MLGPIDLPSLEFLAVTESNVSGSGVSYLPLNARWDVSHYAPMLAALLLHPLLSQECMSN